MKQSEFHYSYSSLYCTFNITLWCQFEMFKIQVAVRSKHHDIYLQARAPPCDNNNLLIIILEW
jgi:hypothetical protein